jgi:hypothetical protein
MKSLSGLLRYLLSVSAFFFLGTTGAAALAAADSNESGEPGEASAKPLNYPADLRAFRARALKADGVFAPDIAFSVRICPKCGNPYVAGTFPRLSRQPFNDLAAVHQTIQETLKKPAPKMMYSARAGKRVPRACPYCGQPEQSSVPDKVLFCHLIPETNDDLQIEYAIKDRRLDRRTFWRVPKDGSAIEAQLPDESEESFKKAFGAYFSLRAVWNGIFAQNFDGDRIVYRNVAPGVYFIFRPEKVSDAQFREFADKQLKTDRDKGLFSHLDSPLKLDDKAQPGGNYLEWAGAYSGRLSKGAAECFVGISFPELRTAAGAAVASRNAVLNLAPEKPTLPGSGFIERGPLKIETRLAPLVKRAVIEGLSLNQACSLYLADGTYTLDSAQHIAQALQSNLAECQFEFADGRILIARDRQKQERKIDLLNLAGKLDPADPLLFTLYRERVLRWDAPNARFGPPPLEREVSPVGLPAFIERRIRPAEHYITHHAPTALFEPLKDSDGKRCDLCYTSECTSTVLYVDPGKPRFKDIPDINTARALYYQEGGTLPSYIDAQDTLTFPGRLPGLLECKTVLFAGTDVSSLAGEESRASQLAVFAELPDATGRISFYAFSTNCAAIAPRPLAPEEFTLLKSRAGDFVKENQLDPGLELNLHFDLPWTKPKGKVMRRKK